MCEGMDVEIHVGNEHNMRIARSTLLSPPQCCKQRDAGPLPNQLSCTVTIRLSANFPLLCPPLRHSPCPSSSGGWCVDVPYVLVWMCERDTTREKPKSVQCVGCEMGQAGMQQSTSHTHNKSRIPRQISPRAHTFCTSTRHGTHSYSTCEHFRPISTLPCCLHTFTLTSDLGDVAPPVLRAVGQQHIRRLQ